MPFSNFNAQYVPTGPVGSGTFKTTRGTPTSRHEMGSPFFRQTRIQGRTGVHITLDTFNAIEEYIRWAQEVPGQLPHAMDILIRFMAYTDQGFSQQMSFGVLDESETRKQYAWRIPVRRITGRYFYGWKVQRVGVGHWRVYNDSREAYFIEFGINPRGEGRRVRRPIRKLALKKTMDAMRRTHAFHRCWCEIYANPRRRKPRSKNFTQIVQSPGMGGFSGPMLGRRLPG
jgi:hypothetical protein